jgi:hypothetical protein
MPARKRQPIHWYSVYVVAYVDEATRARVARGEEDITQPGQITAQSFYMGTRKQQADYAFTRAALAAMNNPLAYAVVMERDHQTLIRVRAERR